MRPVHKPGPKSRTRHQKSDYRPQAPDLGDTDDSETSSFQSPTRDSNQTDYGLEFSSRQQRTTRTSIITQEVLATPSRRSEGVSGTGAGTSAAATLPAPVVPRRRKQRTPMNILFQREVRELMQRTDFMIPRQPFSRLVRELMMQSSSTVTHIQKSALEGLQEASEMYLSQRLQDSYLLTLHRGRVTLSVKDMQLVDILRSNGNT